MASSDNLRRWVATKAESPEAKRVEERLEDLLPFRPAVEIEQKLSELLRPSDAGFARVLTPSLKKLSATIRFFADRHQPLAKIKLMTLLFYADFRSQQLHGTPITAFRYVALPYGPAIDG